MLAVAFLKLLPLTAFAQFLSAIENSRRGDHALANLRLALAGLSQIPEAHDLPERIENVEMLLLGGMKREVILFALGFADEAPSLSKYDADQPRVPAGSGPTSGRWTSGNSAGKGRDPGAAGGQTMTTGGYPEQYYVKCDWAARTEDPASIADRLRRFLDTLREVHETFEPWSVGLRRRAPYQSVRDDLVETIRRDAVREEDGRIEAKAGYNVIGSSCDPRQYYGLMGHAGGTYDTFMCNELSLSTRTYNRTAVDTAIVDYPVMKAMTLTTIACWEPDFCLAGSGKFAVAATGIRYERSCWITYVPPAHAASVDLVGVPFSEWTPNGGLLLSATEQPYDYRNPVHLEGSRRIVQATKHLNATLPPY